MNPVLALALLAAVGLLATRLPRVPTPHSASFNLVLAAGGPLVLLGLVLGPGIELMTRPVLAALAPVSALAIGWIGATLGTTFEWRYVRRIPRAIWLLALVSAGVTFVVVALTAWLATRASPSLAAAWAPRVPALLTLAAVAAVSGPGAVRLAAQVLGIRRGVARLFARVAALETVYGALAMTVPLALLRPHGPARHPELGWLSWMVLAVGSGALVGLVFLSLTRLRPARDDLGMALLATLLFGAGVGYAADLSPFVVCALATVVVVNWSPHRRQARALLAAWEHPIYAIFLIVVGALLTLPTAWILVVVPVLAAARLAVRWVSVRYARVALKLAALPPHMGLATVAQGGAALALGINYYVMYGDRPERAGPGGAVLTTIALAVAIAQLTAPPLLQLALRPPSAPLTAVPANPELPSNASAG